MAIYFYKINEEYGCFSNYEEIIRLLDNPMKAAEMSRNRTLPLRKDWEEVVLHALIYSL